MTTLTTPTLRRRRRRVVGREDEGEDEGTRR